ncbi:class II aldolase/adducin family protein [Clostridium sp. Marseille-P2415]|uniref:class II aldolase/adducin family protein n=1 Tax=Clostridium sp. Marseille-P2415 TaxID=1805471 RepID=UPI00098842DC|nr:class II aldolase/adducin family protein [Clostridium sp. Marseille-P2415]
MDQLKQQIIEAGQGIMDKGLTWGTSGNISLRHGDRVWITASGTVMGSLTEDDIIVCDLEGNQAEGTRKPSKETGMHLQVYRKRPDVGGIVHSSPFFGTLCACSDIPLKTNLFIESMYYDANILSVPYFHAGSKGLADAVAEVADRTNIILMGNHGLLAYDTNLKEALTALEITEQVCRMNVLSRMGGFSLKEVEPEMVREFLTGGYYKKRP